MYLQGRKRWYNNFSMGVLVKKSELRKLMLKRLLSLTEEEVERRSENVLQKLQILSIYREAKVILAYYPLKGEVNILGLMRKAMKEKLICFPVIDLQRREIVPYRVKNLDEDFSPGPYNVQQPRVDKREFIDPGKIDLVITPGIAFDRQKNRLGRGGGYYDRFLKRLSLHTKSVGVAFDFQLVESLPYNLSQDMKVDFLVTEREVI